MSEPGRPVMPCPSCGSPYRASRRGGDPLCPGCWATLPTATRTALRRRDDQAPARREQLRARLDVGTPLREIRIG
ncbi:hypothetical protein ACFQHO_45000 [Actinomadura yumaensis]|uniref:hypothetical protein n=1 Tax=Actinomadura yumaensis TaxID=111807 RepID=UPI001320A806|nr:hypothetical protein [Actinomadura sp. J1-007]